MTVDATREKLYFEAPKGTRFYNREEANKKIWLGSALEGDLKDVNATAVSMDGKLLATGTNAGHVKLARFPLKVSYES